MSESPRPWGRRVLWVIALALTLNAIPLAVIASHQFTDVPDSNNFHGSIGWLADNGITLGCNPPTNNRFCPKDQVTREQMAAFMRRLAQASGAVGTEITDFSSVINVSTTMFVEVLSVQVTPKAQARVVLNAHVALEKSSSTEGRYEIRIYRTSCSGQLIGTGYWRQPPTGGNFQGDTVAVTGFDNVSAPTTYKVCVGKTVSESPSVNVFQRGFTATWSPVA